MLWTGLFAVVVYNYNYERHKQLSDLKKPREDSERIVEMLKGCGFIVKTIENSNKIAEDVKEEFERLTKYQKRKLQRVVITYSGHGQRDDHMQCGPQVGVTKNGCNLHAADNIQGDILCGVRGNNSGVNEMINEVVGHVKDYNNISVRYVILLDSCRSQLSRGASAAAETFGERIVLKPGQDQEIDEHMRPYILVINSTLKGQKARDSDSCGQHLVTMVKENGAIPFNQLEYKLNQKLQDQGQLCKIDTPPIEDENWPERHFPAEPEDIEKALDVLSKAPESVSSPVPSSAAATAAPSATGSASPPPAAAAPKAPKTPAAAAPASPPVAATAAPIVPASPAAVPGPRPTAPPADMPKHAAPPNVFGTKRRSPGGKFLATKEAPWKDDGLKPWSGEWNGTRLHFYAHKGDTQKIKKWKEGLGEVINYTSAECSHTDGYTITGATPLYLACRRKHTETAQFLLANGADPTLPATLTYSDGREEIYTTLYWAACEGLQHLVEDLVNHPQGRDILTPGTLDPRKHDWVERNEKIMQLLAVLGALPAL